MRRLARAAARLIAMIAATKPSMSAMARPEIEKFSTARIVWIP
jgi:hypothetical protein